jgi:HPt (histidine-containing phosphotransfer) domain-containing protein
MDAPVTAESALPDTDPAALDRLKRFGGGKLLGEMIALFLVAAPERIGTARSAAAQGDAESAERALHSLKSSAAQLGALRLQRLSELGEHQVRAGSLDGVGELATELGEELSRVEAWLIRARDEGAA